MPRPDLAPTLEAELGEVVRVLARNRWPFRMHATYDETIRRTLSVLEEVNREFPIGDLRWFFDHCETVSAPQSIRTGMWPPPQRHLGSVRLRRGHSE